MSDKDSKKTAICGVSGDTVVVSNYNINCPCLDCAGCYTKTPQNCLFRMVLENDPCTDDDMRYVLCKNCRTITTPDEINKMSLSGQQEGYCLSRKQYVMISSHNKNGECPCLNCEEQKCKGVLCKDFMPNKCTDTIDYLKGENPVCTDCCKYR